MCRSVKAIFFDIDGTLRDFSTGRIPDSAREALQLAKHAGCLLFVATGRHRLEMEEENLLEGLEFDGYVTLNGQYCYNNHGVICKRPIDLPEVRRMIAILEEEAFPCMFMEADRMYINMVDERVRKAQELISTAIPPVIDIVCAAERDIYQMVPYVGPDRENWIMGQLLNCQATRWSADYAFDITPKGGDKVSGISGMLEHFGISRQEMAAVGDGYNDVSMIRFAGTGIAMGNGCQEARLAADYVTERIENDGLMHAVRYLLNGGIG